MFCSALFVSTLLFQDIVGFEDSKIYIFYPQSIAHSVCHPPHPPSAKAVIFVIRHDRYLACVNNEHSVMGN
jgi:hypothetical protein